MTRMIQNNATGNMETPVAQMSDVEVLAYRCWPSHLTVEQMRATLAWQQSAAFRRSDAR